MTSHPPIERDWPDTLPGVVAFAPLLYVAWADGRLSTEELVTLHDAIGHHPALDPACRETLDAWLDPTHPPSERSLRRMLASVRRRARTLPEATRRSLSDLGLALARAEGVVHPATAGALAEMEEALGVVGVEALREILPVSDAKPVAPTTDLPVAAITTHLYGDQQPLRQRVFDLLADPAFRVEYDWSTPEYRDRVYVWLDRLAAEGLGSLGFPAAHGGAGDLGGFITAFGTLAHHDLSLVVKFGVQFGLFGGSVMFLGTRRHHDAYLHDIGTLALPGCFAMSELGHGSNVWDLETVAEYDAASDTFVVHTPTATARKEWIGNAARHGRLATVFAQLHLDGVSYGVHAFLVPIRDADGAPAPGVRIEDLGHKEGLNGVDNGRLWFDHVRIPRVNLLNRFGDVTAEGMYVSPINSPAKRFFTMLGTLVAGRVSVAGAALSAVKSGLTIAVRYGDRRRQFGPAGGPERPILDFTMHQRRLLPPLATTYGLHFALETLRQRYLARGDDDSREVETLAAGLKAYSTRHTVDTLQACRECCGGQGYLSVNRLPDLKADTDVFTTFEGDNTVLLQLVAKSLLTAYRDLFGDLRWWGVVRFLVDRAATAVTERNALVTRNTDADHLRDPDFHAAAFRYREERLLASVARRLRRRIADGEDSFDAMNACQDHLVALALAHIEEFVRAEFARGVAAAGPAVREALTPLYTLFALSRLEADRGWFLESGYIEGVKAKAIRAEVNRLLTAIRPGAIGLVDAFDIPDHLVQAPIATP